MKQSTNVKNQVQDVSQTAEQVATGDTMTFLARLGYVARGVVYVLVGLLFFLLVSGYGGKATDKQGALQTLGEQPFGIVLLAIVTAGLFCFALWSCIQAFFDTEQQGRGARGVLARLGYAASGLSYGLLGSGALRMVMGAGSSSQSSTDSTQDWTARLMEAPFGVILVVGVGLIVIGTAGYCFYQAYSSHFHHHLHLTGASVHIKKITTFSGRAGYGALGVNFLVIGFFLIIAALQHNPQEAKGLDTVLLSLLQQPYGPWLSGLVAVGFVCYGLFSFVEARYRKINSGHK